MATGLVGQDALAILERGAILLLRERPAIGDEQECPVGFRRQRRGRVRAGGLRPDHGLSIVG
jgi:hypothetical protein